MAINTGCLYGSTGTYKTTNLGWLAKHIYSKTKKPVRWITTDAGGYRPILPFVEAGIIEPLSLINDAQRQPLLYKIVEGYWPKDIENGIRQSKTMLKPDFSNVGGYIFEGITSMSEAIHSLYAGKETGMKAAYKETVSNDFVVEQPNGTNKLLESTLIGSYSMDSYGLVQQNMMRNINYSWTLPVEYVWWSGHDLLTENEDSSLGQKVITGVALTGRAATPRLGKHLGTMIHAYSVPLDSGKIEVRYYFTTHVDNQLKGVTWEAKTRVPGSVIPFLQKEYPLGYFVPKFDSGLDTYISKEEELLSKTSDEVLKWKDSVLKGV